MTYGFLLPLVTDVRIENGLFSWDHEVPAGSLVASPHSPIDFHDNIQVTGSPFYDDDQVVVNSTASGRSNCRTATRCWSRIR
jgi:hypothetical protein